MSQYIYKIIAAIALVVIGIICFCPDPIFRYDYFSSIKGKHFHSQMGEDLILSVIFADRMHNNGGTYVDVGANDPDIQNITKIFYECGWHGINIDPIEENYQKLQAQRPRDINIKIAASNTKGSFTLYKTGERGRLSSFNPEIAKKMSNSIEEVVNTVTLNEILRENKVKDITFLTIDVEGHEKEVLQGIDLKKYRPDVILLESVEPSTMKPSHELWEYILLKNKYEFMHFDGLNRYYVRNESPELKKRFFAAKRIMRVVHPMVE